MDLTAPTGSKELQNRIRDALRRSYRPTWPDRLAIAAVLAVAFSAGRVHAVVTLGGFAPVVLYALLKVVSARRVRLRATATGARQLGGAGYRGVVEGEATVQSPLSGRAAVCWVVFLAETSARKEVVLQDARTAGFTLRTREGEPELQVAAGPIRVAVAHIDPYESPADVRAYLDREFSSRVPVAQLADQTVACEVLVGAGDHVRVVAETHLVPTASEGAAPYRAMSSTLRATGIPTIWLDDSDR